MHFILNIYLIILIYLICYIYFVFILHEQVYVRNMITEMVNDIKFLILNFCVLFYSYDIISKF